MKKHGDSSHQRARSLAFTVLLGLLYGSVTGCSTTAKLDSFADLSKAGVAYVNAANAVIAQATDGSVAADTAVLANNRDPSPKKRASDLSQHTKQLVTQLGLFADIQRHENLVREYFVSLGVLANASDADSAIGSATSGTISALGTLSKKLTEAKVGSLGLPDFAAQATPLVVANLRARALEQELRKNGAAINRELLVSEQLMAFLADKIASDSRTIQGPKEFAAVFHPYINADRLPEDWAATRASFLRYSAQVASLVTAQDAARKLRLALAAAAEDRLAPGQLQLLVTDLTSLVDVLEKVKGRP